MDDGAWDPSFTVAGLAGHDGLGPGVYDLALEPDGGLVAAGRFEYLGQQHVDGLARRGDDGWSADPRLAPALIPRGSPPSRWTRTDGWRWRRTRPCRSSCPSGRAEILRDDGDGLAVVAGSAARSGPSPGTTASCGSPGCSYRGGVRRPPASPGSATTGGPRRPAGRWPGSGSTQLTVDDGSLLVGGAFSEIRGIPAANVASWDGARWTALDLPDATVLALDRDAQGTLFAGGLLSVQGSTTTGGIACGTPSGWESVGGGLANPTSRGVVRPGPPPERDHVGGCFTSAGGTPAAGLARWTRTAWEALDDGRAPVGSAWFSPLACGDEGPSAIWDARIHAWSTTATGCTSAGFLRARRVPSQSLAVVQDGAFVAPIEGGRGFSGAVRSLAVGGPSCAVHAMGGVTHAGEMPVDRRISGTTETGGKPPPRRPRRRGLLGAGGGDSGRGPVEWVRPVPERLREVSGEVFTLGDTALGAARRAGGRRDRRPRLARRRPVGGRRVVHRVRGHRRRERVRPGSGPSTGRVSAVAFGPEGQVVVGGTFGRSTTWRPGAWPAGTGAPGRRSGTAWSARSWPWPWRRTARYVAPPTTARPIGGSSAAGTRTAGGTWRRSPPGPRRPGPALRAARAGPYVVAAGFGWPASGERDLFVWDGDTFRSLAGGVPAISVDTAVLAADGLWFGGFVAEAGPPDDAILLVGIAHLTTP